MSRLTGAYAFAHISGGHLNPAVTIGLFVGRRFPARDIAGYWSPQVLGGLAAAGVLAIVARGTDRVSIKDSGFAVNELPGPVVGRIQPPSLPGVRDRPHGDVPRRRHGPPAKELPTAPRRWASVSP